MWVVSHWSEILTGAGTVIAIASIVAKLTPTKSDNKLVDAASRILRVLAVNPKKDKARE